MIFMTFIFVERLREVNRRNQNSAINAGSGAAGSGAAGSASAAGGFWARIISEYNIGCHYISIRRSRGYFKPTTLLISMRTIFGNKRRSKWLRWWELKWSRRLGGYHIYNAFWFFTYSERMIARSNHLNTSVRRALECGPRHVAIQTSVVPYSTNFFYRVNWRPDLRITPATTTSELNKTKGVDHLYMYVGFGVM